MDRVKWDRRGGAGWKHDEPSAFFANDYIRLFQDTGRRADGHRYGSYDKAREHVCPHVVLESRLG